MNRRYETAYAALALRAHTLLEGVPIHDVWGVELPGGRDDVTMMDLRQVMSVDSYSKANPAVQFLFGLRGLLGRLFGWDKKPPSASRESFLDRLTEEDRRDSLLPPGTDDGPFHLLYASNTETISEIHNRTVHAFSVFALIPKGPGHGYTFYWAIYVQPTGSMTRWYMALIDPFRRWIIYPTILKKIRKAWDVAILENR